MKLKKLLALVLAMAMALTLVACGGGGDDSTNKTKAKELTVAIWDENQRKGLQTIADEWTEESGVKVNINVVEWDSYWTLLEAGASGGTMPDVFWMHSNMAQVYMENDQLLDLNEYIENDENIDLDNYYEGIVNLYSSNGVQYAIPKDHDTIALLYNEALFEKYNVDVPTNDWTWEDVYEAAAKITEAGAADNVYGYAVNTSNNQDGWYNLIYAYGGEVITEDHKGTTIGGDEAKAGMEMVRKLLTVSVPQTVMAETGTDSMFMSNQVAMITQGSWMINTFYTAENGADYKWAMIPYADVNGNGQCDEGERQTAYNGLGWAAAASVSDPDTAYSLISYFCSEEGQTRQAELGVTMAGYMGVSDAFANAFEGLDVSAFIDVEEEGTLFFRPYTRKTSVWEDALQQAGGFLPAWQDPSNAELMAQCCDNAQKIIEEAIANE